MPQAIKYQMQRKQWRKNGEKLEKIPAWHLTKVRNKNEVIAEARNEGRTVHFVSLMDLCHLKNSELEPQFQKYKDIVKDDSGSYALLTEQGSSASQMTAARVMDFISSLPGCAGICLHPGQNGRCTITVKKFPNQNVQIFGYVYQNKWPKS